MAFDIKQMDASVVGSTVVLDETELSVQTKDLATVDSESSVDTVLGVKDGEVVQVSPDEVAGSETLQYTSWTENGITYQVCRVGNVAELSAVSGTLTSSFAAEAAFATIPSGYRPRQIHPQAWDVSRAARLLLTTSGNIASAVSVASGSYIRFTATYICQ